MAHAPEFHRKAFNVTKTIYAKDSTVKACVKMSVHGTLEYRTALASSRPPAGRQFDRAIVEPTLTIKTFRGPKCQTVHSSVQLTSATLQQRWYDDRCSFDPGIYVGFPFAVGVSATGHCGQVHVAQRSTTSSADQSSYRQSNSGVRIRFGDTMSSYGRPPPCIAFDATAKITVRGASDIVTETFKVCPR